MIQLQAASIFKILPENDLHKGSESDAGEKFLMEEIKVLEEVKMIGLPNFMPGNAFSYPLLQNKVRAISSMPIDKVWDYIDIEEVMVAILKRHLEHYHQLQSCTQRAEPNC